MCVICNIACFIHVINQEITIKKFIDKNLIFNLPIRLYEQINDIDSGFYGSPSFKMGSSK
jgi:hypothetical protein